MMIMKNSMVVFVLNQWKRLKKIEEHRISNNESFWDLELKPSCLLTCAILYQNLMYYLNFF